uniref:Uncharacterized protein n=1 Tax=Ditylum brightwellii TaxID=49249 RepID=A0A7S2EBH5_9STRA
MCSTDASPVNTEFGSIFPRSRALGDEGNTLTEVKFSVVFGVNTLDLDQGDAVVLGAETTFVSKDGSVYVQASWLTCLHFFKLIFYFDSMKCKKTCLQQQPQPE